MRLGRIRKTPRKRMRREAINPSLLRYPRRQSEFEIQAYLYCELRSLGMDARGEVRAGKESRFDLVVFEERVATQIIEVKTKRLSRRSPSLRLREAYARKEEQMARYRQYNVPVHLIEGMQAAEMFIQKLREERGQGAAN